MKTPTPFWAIKATGAAAALFAAVCAIVPARAQTQLITNGGFETGDFTGWTQTSEQSALTSTAGFFIGDNTPSPVVVMGDGTGPNDVIFTPTTPVNGLPTVGAKTGNFYAVSDGDGAANNALTQTFFVPQSATSVSLSFALFVNARDGGGAQNTNGPLDYSQATPTQFARVDLLSASASPFSTNAGDVLANFYASVDPVAGPNSLYPTPYTVYNFNISGFVVAGGTYQIRIADVGNQFIVNTGIDDVSILAVGPSAGAPEPGSATLLLLGGAASVRLWRRAKKRRSAP